jgi:hypothetical protein
MADSLLAGRPSELERLRTQFAAALAGRLAENGLGGPVTFAPAV